MNYPIDTTQQIDALIADVQKRVLAHIKKLDMDGLSHDNWSTFPLSLNEAKVMLVSTLMASQVRRYWIDGKQPTAQLLNTENPWEQLLGTKLFGVRLVPEEGECLELVGGDS